MTSSAGARSSRTWYNVNVYPGEPGKWPAIVTLVKNTWDPERGNLPPDMLSREYVEHSAVLDHVAGHLASIGAIPRRDDPLPF